MADVEGLFRTPLLVDMLRCVLSEREAVTIDELASKIDGAYPTVAREVRRLERLGVVTVTTIGRTKLLSCDRSDASIAALGDLLAVKRTGKKRARKRKQTPPDIGPSTRSSCRPAVGHVILCARPNLRLPRRGRAGSRGGPQR